jgi:hypothetical protein
VLSQPDDVSGAAADASHRHGGGDRFHAARADHADGGHPGTHVTIPQPTARPDAPPLTVACATVVQAEVQAAVQRERADMDSTLKQVRERLATMQQTHHQHMETLQADHTRLEAAAANSAARCVELEGKLRLAATESLQVPLARG